MALLDLDLDFGATGDQEVIDAIVPVLVQNAKKQAKWIVSGMAVGEVHLRNEKDRE